MTHIRTERCLTPSTSPTPTPLFLSPSTFQPVTIVTCVERLRGEKEVRGVGEGEDVWTTHQDMQREILVIHLLDH